MKFDIPRKYRLSAALSAAAVLAFVFYLSNVVLGEDGAADCCATEFDPTTAQTQPAP